MDNEKNYKGFYYLSKNTKHDNQLESNIDACLQYIESHDQEPPKMHDEILSCIILTEILPDHKIIKMDNGSADKQNHVDFLAIDDENQIKIEVTRYVEKNYINIKNKKPYPTYQATREWDIYINNNSGTDIHKNIKYIDNLLYLLENRSSNNDDILGQDYLHNQNYNDFIEITALKALGINHFFSPKNSCGKKQIIVNIGGTCSLGEDKYKPLKKALMIAENECQKEDNQKKLCCKLNSQKRAIFIPIEFSFDAAQYIEWLMGTNYIFAPNP